MQQPIQALQPERRDEISRLHVAVGARQQLSVTPVRVVLTVALFLGAYQTAIMRDYMNPDGVSYLDLGDRIWTDSWFASANGYWSPLYPALVGGALKLANPSMYHEFAVVHVVNLLIYTAALFAFRFFWDRAVSFAGDQTRQHQEYSRASWLLLAYSIFVWVSLSLHSTGAVGPDLLVSVFVYLAGAILLKLNSVEHGLPQYLMFGALLGMAYLAKAAMFLVALIFLAVALFGPAGIRRSGPRVLAATLVFLVISATWIVPLSRASGHLTFGESGPINYAWSVSGTTRYSKQPAAVNQLKHPVAVIGNDPPVYHFAGPIRGSYRFWTNPAYWLDGMTPRFDLSRQIRALAGNVGRLLTLPGLLFWGALFLFLALLVTDRKTVQHQVARFWVLLVPSLAATFMYMLAQVEGRYIAPFLAISFGALLVALSFASSQLIRQVVPALALSVGTLLIASVLVDTWVKHIKRGTPSSENEQVAAELKQLGFHAGEAVGSIGDAYNAYWARLARVQIIAEIEREDASSFWAARPEKQRALIEAFRKTGARAIIADNLPSPDANNGWRQLSKTKYYLYDLRATSGSASQDGAHRPYLLTW